jgi:L-alanine-DL-glutamate epimerase-like enolase superfamily enzyme
LKITGVRTVTYEYPLLRPLGNAHNPTGTRRMANLAVFLETDEELVGVAITFPRAERHVKALVNQVLVGRDPYPVRGLFDELLRYSHDGGNNGAVAWAIGALDIALWDLRAKRNGVPLWKELGATSNRVRAYASGLDSPLSDDELATFYKSMAELGIAAGKLKVGRDPNADIRRLGIVRDALTIDGRLPSLMIDANEYWSPKQAIRRVAEMEEQFDLLWVEEPAPRWDVGGLRRVSHAIRSAVASGEHLANVSQFVPLIADEAIDVVQVGVYSGGITGSLRIAELAAAFGLQVSMMNNPGRMMAHAAAAMPNHVMMEVLNVGRDVALSTDYTMEDGWIVLGDAPGLGIQFKDDQLERLGVEHSPTEALWEFRASDAMAGLLERPFDG